MVTEDMYSFASRSALLFEVHYHCRKCLCYPARMDRQIEAPAAYTWDAAQWLWPICASRQRKCSQRKVVQQGDRKEISQHSFGAGKFCILFVDVCYDFVLTLNCLFILAGVWGWPSHFPWHWSATVQLASSWLSAAWSSISTSFWRARPWDKQWSHTASAGSPKAGKAAGRRTWHNWTTSNCIWLHADSWWCWYIRDSTTAATGRFHTQAAKGCYWQGTIQKYTVL